MPYISWEDSVKNVDIMELDLVICIDTTPSMEKCVRDLQANGETVTDSLFLEIEKLRIAVNLDIEREQQN